MAVVLRLLPLLIGTASWTSSPLKFPSHQRRHHLGSVKLAAGRGDDKDTEDTEDDTVAAAAAYSHLVSKLDLQPLVEHVAGYSCLKRGKESMRSLVNNNEDNTVRQKAALFPGQAKRRRQDWFDQQRLVWKRKRSRDGPAVRAARSADEAIREFNLVGQAMDVLVQKKSPPLFRLNKGEPSEVESDEDEWVDLCVSDDLPPGMDLYQEIDLQTILQAEQVAKLVIDTYAWADEVQGNAPELADVMLRLGDPVPGDDQTEEADEEERGSTIDGLIELYRSLSGAVEIVRSGPSLSDPYNRFSYVFRLSSDDARFPDLNKLRRKEERLLRADAKKSQQLAVVQNEISVVSNLITRRLISSMITGAPDAGRGVQALARLDTIFARASYGLEWHCLIPRIGSEGRIRIDKFVHPVLSLTKHDVVPIDLNLDQVDVLMISGSNGGGKTVGESLRTLRILISPPGRFFPSLATLALKSFGLVQMMMKLGIPIPSQVNSDRLTVDFFDEVSVQLGDNQNVAKGESTLMAKLNAVSSIIQGRNESGCRSSLVLLDELGGDTDPVAGSALSQAILERLICKPSSCKVVATTHSPQLKALAVNNDEFGCASVILGGPGGKGR
ncbi:hypothetical protein THAOC_18295, partial [Thalassiosira oceanica]